MSAVSPPSKKLDPGNGLVEQGIELPDGRRIRIIRAGRGPGPLIVFEAGMSAPAASWAHSQRELSSHARTLSYDRAGYGGSDVDGADRTLERLTEDLTGVLDAIGENEPVILVGHSWGGPILRCFAAQHSQRVAGLVFVDGTVAELMTPGIARLNIAVFTFNSLLTRLGRSAMVLRGVLPNGFAAEISSEDRALLVRDFACASAMATGRREAQHIGAAVPLLKKLQSDGAPDVPTVCLQGGRVQRGSKKMRGRWNVVVEKLMASAPHGRLIVVDGAGHLIPQEAPETVNAAILDVVSQVASPSGREEDGK